MNNLVTAAFLKFRKGVWLFCFQRGGKTTQTKRLKFPWSFFAAVFIFSLAACVPAKPAKPGNPAYSWLNGQWIGETGFDNPVQADFRVINGNQLTGSVTYHSSSGSVTDGTIQSGVVDRKNDVDFVKGKIYWSFGTTSTFLLIREQEGLVGSLAQDGALSSDRYIEVKKAKKK